MKKYENYSSFPEAVDPLIFFQDIDIPHKAAYDTFRQMISNGQYSAALEYINSQDDVDGYFADLYNLLEERILNLQYHLKCMDNRIIYTNFTPGANYPYLHANVIWLNYNISTGQTAYDSQDALVNEIIKENMEIRSVDNVSVSGTTKSVHALVPSMTVCFEDIFLDKTTSMKEHLYQHKLNDVVWYAFKQYTHNEDIIQIIVTDEEPKGAEYYAPPTSILSTKVNGTTKALVTMRNQKLKIVSEEPKVSKVIIYNTFGEKVASYSYPREESAECNDFILGYRSDNGLDAIQTKDNKYISINTSDISIVPASRTDYIHAKFRIMANLPTLLWHRLSFVTDESDAIVDEGTTVKVYLDRFLDHVEMNVKSIVSAYKSLGVVNNVTNISEATSDYTLKKKNIVDTIEEVTEDTGHLNTDSSPTAIATYILNKMYTPVIDAVRRAAVRRGVSMSNVNTLDNAIKTLKQFLIRYLKVKDSSGNSYVLTTKSGQVIRLKGGI